MSGAWRPRRRATEACIFCRKRKIKCNNEQPTCANCKTYGKDCIYEPLAAAAASTNQPAYQARRKSIRGAITSGREVHVASNQSRVDPSTQNSNQDRDEERPLPASRKDGIDSSSARYNQSPQAKTQSTSGTHRLGVSRMVVSANGVSSYHGRTSTLFEETIQERVSAAESRPRMPDEWIEKGLVAEAAKQSQLEEFNYRAGTLDFDGVDPELGMHLLFLHWNRQHHSFLITYRPAFMRDMACAGPYFSKILLNAIYFGASKFSPRREVRRDPDDVRTAGWRFRERVRGLLGEALDCSEITTIQALLVMTNSLFALGDERSAAWLYAGLAFRMIIDLGMHVDAPDLGSPRRFSDEDVEIRRRVFWGAFVVDKIQSLYQGRPATLHESDTAVPIKFLDTYEELQNWQPFAYSVQSTQYPGSPAYSVSTFTSLCRLSVVMSDILSSIYTERTFDQSAVELCAVLEKLNSKLAAWKDALPSHLTFDPVKPTQIPPPHVLSLHAMYHVLAILLHRPFVADGHLYNTSRSIPVNSFLICASAADSIAALLRAYDKAFSVRHAPYLISYATYVAATIHVRIAAKRSTASEARDNLETCLGVFKDNQKTNWAVRKAKTIVEGLMERLGVSLADPGGHGSRQSEVRRPPPGSDGQASQPSKSSSHRMNAVTGQGLEQTDSTVSAGSTTSPSAGWSDIDGIIQSFVQGQNGNHEDASEGLGHIEAHQAQRRTSTAVTTQMLDFNGMGSSMDTRQGADANSAPWIGFQPPYSGVSGVAASFEDLLFGFNGSALDSSFY
ncbi:carbohydrate esterase family 12 protein [Apiospora arundinis]